VVGVAVVAIGMEKDGRDRRYAFASAIRKYGEIRRRPELSCKRLLGGRTPAR
jgi:hypothetical protein